MLALALVMGLAAPAGQTTAPAASGERAAGRPPAATGGAFRPKGPLAGLPSRPGPHLERIRALGEDAWMELGPPAPDPNWGKARGRSWTPRMPYAPELRAAFLCGCGIHGYVRPDGHYMDDLWAYDVNGHRWVCVWPGPHAGKLRLKLDRDGFEVDDRGEHVPVSYLGHGYCNLTYLPDLHRLLVIYTHSPWWTRALPQRWDWLDANDKDVRTRNYGHAGPVIENPKHPLFYDVAAGRWQRRLVAGDGPGPRLFEGVVEYLPETGRAFYLYAGRVWLYDPAANAWTASKAPRVDVGYDSWGCYDARRQRVYVARKDRFLAYDARSDRWTDVRGEGQPADLGSCNFGAITYDDAADAVLILLKAGPDLHVYSPGRNAWAKAARPPAQLDWRRRCVNGFYDPALAVHFYHLAGDSDDNGTMLVYRHRAAPGATLAPAPGRPGSPGVTSSSG